MIVVFIAKYVWNIKEGIDFVEADDIAFAVCDNGFGTGCPVESRKLIIIHHFSYIAECIIYTFCDVVFLSRKSKFRSNESTS